MKLRDLYQQLDSEGRAELAKKAQVDVGYLWQLATRWRGKRPSLALIERLALADKRLKKSDLVSEFTESVGEAH